LAREVEIKVDFGSPRMTREIVGDAILGKKTDSLLECFLDDDNMKMLIVLRSDVSYDFPLKQGKFR
jgi:hypothetical protein